MMCRNRSQMDIRGEINTLEQEAEIKKEELEKINNKLDCLYGELRYNEQEEKTKTIEVKVSYGGRLPVAPESDFE